MIYLMHRDGLFLFFAMSAATLTAAGGNMIDSSPSAWRTWSPRPALAPSLEARQTAAETRLFISAKAFSQYGEWFTVVKGVQAGAYYRFDVLSRAESVDNEAVSVAAMLSWCSNDCTEEAIQRDYADREAEAGEWRRTFRVVRAPEGARAVKVELMLRWTARGSVVWKDASLVQTEAPKPRIVRVATTHVTPPVPSTLAVNLEMMASMLDKAGAEKADVVCLSENVAGRGVEGPADRRAKEVSGPTIKLLAEKAKKYRMYVISTVEEPEGGLVYNTAFFFDRNGKLAAKYRKIHLPLAEAELGYTPGNEYAVVDTDFGRVGILICWDYWFPETVRIARLKGAEMLLLPIAGDAGVHWDAVTKARAMENGLYLVASGLVAGGPSRIVAPDGEVLAEVTGQSALAVRDIDLNKEFRTPWLSVGPGLGEGKSLYIKERRSDTYGPLVPGEKAR